MTKKPDTRIPEPDPPCDPNQDRVRIVGDPTETGDALVELPFNFLTTSARKGTTENIKK